MKKDEFDELYHGEFLLDESGEIRYTDREKILNEIDRVYGTDTMYLVDSVLNQRENMLEQMYAKASPHGRGAPFVDRNYNPPRKESVKKEPPKGPSKEEIKKILKEMEKQEDNFKLE